MTRCTILALALLSSALAPRAHAYPGGTPSFVADVAPYCASCHASLSIEQLAGVPEARAGAELIANKHLAKIKTPSADSPYAKLSEGEREALMAGIVAIDQATTLKLTAPTRAKPGETIEVVVEATGGAAPVVGIALVDSALRFQASPATARGWQVVERPEVTGPDGARQTKFTDGRNAALPPGVTYVNVSGIATDLGAKRFSSVRVAWKLRAPAQPGKTPLAAVLLYGTELSAPHGAVETPYGKQPLGTYTGSSGRVKFSDVLQVDVR